MTVTELLKQLKDLGVEAKRLSEPALARLIAFDYPGNVRELENVIERLVVTGRTEAVQAALKEPNVIARYKALGLGIPKQSPDQWAAGLKAEAALWEWEGATAAEPARVPQK